MGSLGFTEIMVVLVIALIVLGPARLPDAARSLGKAVRELRNLTSGFEREVKAAFDDTDTPQPTAKEAEHGIDPGALAPGMSYGQPVGSGEVTDGQQAVAPSSRPSAGDDER